MQIYSIFSDFSLPNFSYVWLRMLTYVYLCTCLIETSLLERALNACVETNLVSGWVVICEHKSFSRD